MRVTGFASRGGDTLVIETFIHFPGAGEAASRNAAAFGPGPRRREAEGVVVDPAEVEQQWLDDHTRVCGFSNRLELLGRTDESGAYLEGSGGWRIVPSAFAPEVLLVSVRGEDARTDHHLPRSFALPAESPASPLRLVTAAEAMLAQLAASHRDRVFFTEDELRRKLGIPTGAVKLFAFDDLAWPLAGEPASASIDVVAMCAALQRRRAIRRLPGPANSRPEHWYPRFAELRRFGGGDAWGLGDVPVPPARREGGPGATPWATELLERGWPHGVMLLHDPGYHAPGVARAAALHAIEAAGPALRVFWPRGAAASFARAVGRAESSWSASDAGVAAALDREGPLREGEAAALVLRLVERAWDPPRHAATELVLILESLVGGDEVVEAMATALETQPERAFSNGRPALAAALFELGFVVRRLPERASPWLADTSQRGHDRAWARDRLRRALAGSPETSDVARALELAIGGRAAAERLARAELDLAHATDDVAWAGARLADADIAPSPIDVSLVPLGAEALLARWASRIADEPDPAWAATQLAKVAGKRAIELLRAIQREHPGARDAVEAALAERGSGGDGAAD
jgi:hypothetical protein